MTRSLVLCIVLAALAAPALHAQSFQGLGVFPQFSSFKVAYDVSADGSVVVGTGLHQSDQNAAFKWTEAGGSQWLPGLSGSGGNSYGVSADGTVVVGASGEAVRWGPGNVILDLGRLPTPEPYQASSTARAASADGAVIVGNSTSAVAGNLREAFRWENGTMQGLGVLEIIVIDDYVFTESGAVGVSNDGSVIVGHSGTTNFPGCSRDEGCRMAVRWVNGAIEGLGALGVGGGGLTSPYSYATAVSADGRVIVGYSTTSGSATQVGFRYANGVMQSLGMLPGGVHGSEANDISADGRVIVGRSDDGSELPSSAEIPYIWTAETGMRRVRDVLVAQGVDLTGWTLTDVDGVSADGTVIVGTGTNPSGQTEGWRAVLVPADDIVVTTTGDEPNDPDSQAANVCDVDTEEPESQCTLRAAIELANERGGATITFDIPGDGVPSIVVTEYSGEATSNRDLREGLPAFRTPITLDGTTQPGGWVEVSGLGVRGGGEPNQGEKAEGIRIGPSGSGSTIRGLVVNRFYGSPIHVYPGADGCTIEGNRIGTDVTGTLAMGTPSIFHLFTIADSPRPLFWFDSVLPHHVPIVAGIRIGSSGNVVQDNVVAGNANRYIRNGKEAFGGGVDVLLDRSSQGNVVRRNRIGIGADGQVVSVSEPGDIGDGYNTLYLGVLVQGANQTIGGTGGDGNVIANHTYGILVRSPSGNVIAGNQINQMPDDRFISGTGLVFVNETHRLGYPDGTSESGRGRVEDNVVRSVEVEAAIIIGAYELTGNMLHGRVNSDSAPLYTNFHEDAAVLLGGDGFSLARNEIRGNGWAVLVSFGRGEMVENEIEGGYGGVRIPIPDDGQIHIDGTADPQRVVLARNRIVTHGAGLPIDLGGPYYGIRSTTNTLLFDPDGVTLNDYNDSDSGPNDLLNFPDIHAVSVEDGVVSVRGFVEAPIFASTPYFVEVFSAPGCVGAVYDGGLPYGSGEHYLGVGGGNASLGYVDFDFSLPDLPPGHTSVTFTSTRLDIGITSEYSRCIRLVGSDQVASATVGPDQTGPIFDDLGTTVSRTSTARPDGTATNNARRGGGGTLYVTRYDARPALSVFADTTASAPSGAQIHPEAVAERNWLLADRGLTPAGGAPDATPTFDVCLRAEGTILPGSLESVVVVQRDEATGGLWEPRATTLEDHGGEPYLCAADLTSLGEMGLGGAEASFPVGSEPGATPEASDPSAFTLSAFPNPSRGAITVSVAVPEPGHVRADVYDALGRRLARLHDGPLAAGVTDLLLDASALPTGVYVVRAQVGTTMVARRLTVVR